MTPTDHPSIAGWRPDRRTFLVAGTAALAAAACSGSDGASTSTAAGTTGDDASTTTDTTEATTGATEAPSGTTAPATTEAAVDADAEAQAALEPLTPAMFDAPAVCTLSAPATEGPFPNLERLDRSDISEGYPGHPLRLGLRVVDASCNPVPDAVVEIWHADASGDYSSYTDNGTGKDEGAGTTFCRGNQTSDADGIVEFHTVYPGWYSGRAVHIHLQVLVGGSEVLTTQLYFDEGYTDAVFETGEYAQFGPPDTRWADDRIVGSPDTDGTGLTLSPALTIAGDGTLGLLNIGTPV